MKPRTAPLFAFIFLTLIGSPLLAERDGGVTRPRSSSGQPTAMLPPTSSTTTALSAQPGGSPPDYSAPQAAGASSKPAVAPDPPHKLGPLTLFGNWRFRTEGWDWFQPATGQNAYAFEHSLLFLGIRQDTDRFEWLIEGAQNAILGLPNRAIAPGVQGQLGLGGTYFAANGSSQNNADGFLKQAYFGLKLPARGRLRLGRFGFSDGTEVQPKDSTVADLVRTRIAQRLIGEFTFSAVERSFDGAQLAFNAGNSNFTFLAARPTEGVYQVDAMGEINVDLFYGAYTLPVSYRGGSGELRVFALGYADTRNGVLKTDNRPLAMRTADTSHIQIGTYGADYVHVFHTARSGQFDLLAWGALQSGSWGVQSQRSGAFVGEAGWQPPVQLLKPWFSAGYSFGSGDSNPTDNVHGTFFQVLPTPRIYALFPFYNMQNDEDFYGTGVFRLPRSIALRTEGHALRLANGQDLWYLGGGAYQSGTFGYLGRAAAGSRSLANVWDISLDLPLRYGFSVTAYYGYAWGKTVIKTIYPAGTTARFGYVETNFRF